MILFLGAYPHPSRVREGSSSRAAAIDQIFQDEERVYVTLSPAVPYWETEPVTHENGVKEYILNPRYSSHHTLLRSLVLRAQLTYCTAIQHGLHAIPFLRTGRIVVDVHGVAPEEELLHGRPGRAAYLEAAEEEMVHGSRHLVVVTEAMKRHLLGKYPEAHPNIIVIPILEEAFLHSVSKDAALTPRKRSVVLYSGGLHRWQNVERMLEVVRLLKHKFEFRFLTNEPEQLAAKAAAAGLQDSLSIACVAKSELINHYLEADYGLILRDDIVVNRVACPTKMMEYMAAGVIPIVLSPALGDFPELGCRHLALEAFLAGELPDEEAKLAIRTTNLQCIEKLAARFRSGVASLKELVRSTSAPTANAGEFLTPYERLVLYPAHTRITIDDEAKSAGQTLFLEHPAPFHTIAVDLDPSKPCHGIVIEPMGCACCARLLEVVLLDSEGSSVSFTMHGNFTRLQSGAITAFQKPLRIRLKPHRPTRLSRLEMRMDFLLLDQEVGQLSWLREMAKRSRALHYGFTRWVRPLASQVTRRFRSRDAVDG